IGAGLLALALLSGPRRNLDLLFAGAFAALYALRMIMNTPLASSIHHIAYYRAALEYLVPIPGAALFAHYFSARWRRMNLAIVIAFSVVAAVAIPYEVLTGQPAFVKPLVDALVIVFMCVGVLNLATQTTAGVSLFRIGGAIFVAYVFNEHLHFVNLPWRLSSEPVGFLIFVSCIVVALMRSTVLTQGRLFAVESELTTARAIQQSIIPLRPPAIDGLDIAALYRPASQVGGDFYEFVEHSGDRAGIFVADVSGHGVPAALVASMLKIAIAAQDGLDRPDAILGNLNRLFCGRLQRQFFTAAYALFDPSKQTLSLASGGHPPAILLRRGDSLSREIAAPGFVLGRMADASFSRVEERFGDGDIAVLYTDGIVEATGRGGEQWGYERLRLCVEAHRDDDAAEIAAAIFESVERWSLAKGAEDDLTLVVVHGATLEARST
ncbi:MAG: PP2C family protein-serine/threonine phosphatase, partial [Thermoanaerobaculia bacterium]